MCDHRLFDSLDFFVFSFRNELWMLDVRLQEKHGARTATSVPGTDIDAMKHGAAEGSGITLDGAT